MSRVAQDEERPKGNVRGYFWGYEDAQALAEVLVSTGGEIRETRDGEVLMNVWELECLLSGRDPVCFVTDVEGSDSLDRVEMLTTLEGVRGRYRFELLDADGRIIEEREGDGGG